MQITTNQEEQTHENCRFFLQAFCAGWAKRLLGSGRWRRWNSPARGEASTRVMVQLGFEPKNAGGFGASTGERGGHPTPLSSFKSKTCSPQLTWLTCLCSGRCRVKVRYQVGRCRRRARSLESSNLLGILEHANLCKALMTLMCSARSLFEYHFIAGCIAWSFELVNPSLRYTVVHRAIQSYVHIVDIL